MKLLFFKLFNVSEWVSEIAQSCPTLCDPVDCSLPGSSVHGILQARTLEWVTISFSRGSSQPRDGTRVSRIGGRRFNLWATREALGRTINSRKHFLVVVQSLSWARHFETPQSVACQASLSFTISQSLLILISIEAVMSSNHLILCHPLLLPFSIFLSIRIFSNESALLIRWPKYWSFSFSISSSNECLGLLSFRMDWLDLTAVQRTLKSLLWTPKHRFFGTQPSFWSNSHIHKWLLEKP